MNFRTPSLRLLSAVPLICAFISTPAIAAWQVDNSKSEFHFVTTKAGKAGTTATEEVQSFKQVDGKVDDSGVIAVSVDLGSVDTGISIRDQRLKEMLFNVANNPKAVFSGKVDIEEIKKIPVGAMKDVDLNGTITLCGQSHPVVAKLRVVSLGQHKLLVETRAPFIVNAADFGIQAGVDALREVMGLNVLSSAAPVSFSIVLK